jgi:hypothetical protein
MTQNRSRKGRRNNNSTRRPKREQVVETDPDIAPLSNTFDTTPTKERLEQLEDIFLDKMKAAQETGKEAIEVILKIRDERQYLAGGFPNFDTYMETRWNHTRQWVSQMENHLQMIRLMQDKFNVTPDDARKKLTVYDGTILRPLSSNPEIFVEAIKEAVGKYKAAGKKSPTILKEVVSKWEQFKPLNETLQSHGIESLTVEEFGLIIQLQKDKHNTRLSDLAGKTLLDLAKEKVEAQDIPMALALESVCAENKGIPTDEQLLKEARGPALKDLIAPLIVLVKYWNAEKKLHETAALKDAQKAEAELTTLKKELAKTPAERQAEEEERKNIEKAKKERAEKTHRVWKREQEIWEWNEDELSLSKEVDPRKWVEAENDEGYLPDLLVRIAADCLADAFKRLPMLDVEDKSSMVKAAKKVMTWAEEVVAQYAD